MTDEHKQLIEDAAKLLGYIPTFNCLKQRVFKTKYGSGCFAFNPLDPERGDLMKVAMAAKLFIDYENGLIGWPADTPLYQTKDFEPNNYQSLALAVLRAASAVWKARRGE